jgi:CheY-like chemotaxis protein/DNA-binding XRE family transcriptional regulator
MTAQVDIPMGRPTSVSPTKWSGAAGPAALPEPRELQCTAEVHILVMDDDPVICDVIREALADREYKLEAVCEPAQMLTRLQAQPYHLILMDYCIPGLSPEQVFGLVQQHQPDASIIVITGYPSVDSALNSLRARAYDYLTKPFKLDQLQQVVQRCLESKGLLRMSEDALRESLGLVIRERRKGQGLTLKQLADRTSVSLGYLSQIELGKNSASIETLYRISLGLGIKLADLFHAVEQRS